MMSEMKQTSLRKGTKDGLIGQGMQTISVQKICTSFRKVRYFSTVKTHSCALSERNIQTCFLLLPGFVCGGSPPHLLHALPSQRHKFANSFQTWTNSWQAMTSHKPISLMTRLAINPNSYEL